MKKNRLSLLVVVILVITMLGGCLATPKVKEAETTKAVVKEEAKEDSKDTSKTEDNAPEEPKEVSVILLGPATEEAYFREQLEQFEVDHPNIKVDLTFTPNDGNAYGNSVQLMFASDESPDIFRISGSLSTGMFSSFEKGWLQPLNEYITPEVEERFPEGAFSTIGGLQLDGNVYGLPLVANQFPAFRPFIYNMDILNEYGFAEAPTTWAELKTVTETITNESKGDVYGMGIVTKGHGGAYGFRSLGETIRTTTADAHLTEGNFIFNTETGMSDAANEGSLEAVRFMKELNDADVMIPGWEVATNDEMIQYFATEKVAVLSGQSWFPARIKGINPDLNILSTVPPKRSEEDNGHRFIYSVADPYFGMSSFCENPDEAWEVMNFMTSIEFQVGFYDALGRVTVGYNNYAEGAMTDYMVINMQAADDFLRIAPNPADIHKDANILISKVLAHAPKPSLNELYLLSIVKEEDFEALAKAYDKEMDIIVDEQVAAMQAEGSDITRAALIFPEDWKLDENYIK